MDNQNVINSIIDDLEYLKLIVKELEERLKGLENEHREHLLCKETETA